MLRIRTSIEAMTKRFDEAIAGAKSEKVGLTLLRDKRRWLCRNDLFYLCKFTGNDRIAQLKDIYEPFCDEVSLMNWQIVKLNIQQPSEMMLSIKDVTDNPDDDLFMQRLYLCYRTYYKTTIVTKVHSLQLLLNFPNIRLVIAHNKQENASDNLVTIKNYFLTTPIRQLFPECIPDSKEWGNMSGFSLANRTDWSKDEANIEAVGVDTEFTGRHWQVAKKDDLVTDKSVNTEEQIVKTVEWDKLFNMGQFDDVKFPLQDYSGTRYHHTDMYSVKKNDSRIKLVEIPILKDTEQFLKGDDTQIMNPQRFTRKDIEDLMSDMWFFNCQMMLKPDDPARMTFTKEMIKTYIELPECRFYLLVDPASRRKKKSDYTAMAVIGLDRDGKRYIADMIRDKLNPNERIDEAMRLIRKWRIKEVGWEEMGLNDDVFYLEEKRKKEDITFTVKPIKTLVVKKEDRIRNILMPEYASHKWFWPPRETMIYYSKFHGKNFDMVDILEREFTQFPLSEHDDMLDTQTFLSQMDIIQPEGREEKEYLGMTFGDLIRLKEDRLAETRRNPWGQFKVLERI